MSSDEDQALTSFADRIGRTESAVIRNAISAGAGSTCLSFKKTGVYAVQKEVLLSPQDSATLDWLYKKLYRRDGYISKGAIVRALIAKYIQKEKQVLQGE